MYFLGGIVPPWSIYGVKIFKEMPADFYVSLSVRCILTLAAIFVLDKVLAANQPLNERVAPKHTD